MSVDSIGHDTGKVFKPTNTGKVKKTPRAEKDGRKKGSEDPSLEQEDFSGRKRNSKDELPTYDRDGKLHPHDKDPELDFHG